MVLHLAVGILPIVFLVAIGLALQGIADGSDGSVSLVVALLAFACSQVLAPIQAAASLDVAMAVDGSCTDRLMRHALRGAPLRSLESTAVADELAKATEGLDLLQLTPGHAAEGALALIARYTQLAGAVTVLVVVAGWVPGVLALVVALVSRGGQTTAFRRWGRVIGTLGPARRRILYLRDLGGGAEAAKELRSLGLVDWLDAENGRQTRSLLRDLWAARRRIYGRPFAVYALLGAVGTVAALVVVSVQGARAGGIAEITMAVQAVVLCARFGVMFPESDVKLVYGLQAWTALLAAEALSPPERTGGAEAPALRRALDVRGVRFGYDPDPAAAVLSGLDLTIEAGTSLAVVGTNGAGKTTLVKLLTGLYQPDDGVICVDGTDLATVDPETWSARCAVLFQDFVRYDLTLRENVAAGAIEHLRDDAGILAALRRAGLGALTAPDGSGLDLQLGRPELGGVDLSGGQWQRVALARALFAVSHGAELLVLDEPTAQLDARGEAEFYETFLDLTRGTTTSIVISHRFSTVRRADRIVVVRDGRVSEQGSHDELVALDGYYARAFAAQAGRFVEAVTER